ncbi:glycosyltransferase family 2 protein [Rhizobium sp. BK376]|uniref:glycosyltransferase family 2 protein n=1 Tax=Rhizobium sp. BK376 TaxID=2512149 RepID=UPI00104C0319|nr:glycosyltransferase family 2 protein [Rhizobium sp. BK376]TCR71843.1 succinoglycan biosynthesis protein ExoO [Rhizobium sp. BK376]
MSEFIPDVSFIIAAYNAEDTLERAIDSALGQGGVSMEVIVVDDCSTDGTRSLAENHGDPRVRVVALPRNGGPSAARNAGLDVATGRWVAVLDSDDAMRPDRLARMIARAEKAEAKIAVDNLDVVRENADEYYTMFPDDKLARLPEMSLADFITSNVIFRSEHNFGYMKPIFERAFIESHGLRFDENLKIGEDYIFLASALADGGRCVVEPMAGYIYYIRKGSISRVLEIHHVDAMIEADKRFLGSHTLDAEALAAQRRRARSLREARSFLNLVQSIKSKSPVGVLKNAFSNPRAVRHLSMPIVARLKRFAAFFRRRNEAAAASSAALPSMGKGPHSNKG